MKLATERRGGEDLFRVHWVDALRLAWDGVKEMAPRLPWWRWWRVPLALLAGYRASARQRFRLTFADGSVTAEPYD